MLLNKRHIGVIYICIIFFLVILTLHSLHPEFHALVAPTPTRGQVTSTSKFSSSSQPKSLVLPEEYRQTEPQPSVCEHRYGLAYLEDLVRDRATYCTKESGSHFTCFHSQTDKSGRVDSFCIGQGAKLDETGKSFQTSCHLLDIPLEIETNKSSLSLESFPRYWYETGPRNIIDKYVKLSVENLEPPSRNNSEGFTVLVKREGSANPWHSLMEIMSLSMTIDVLRASPNPRKEDGEAFLTEDDANNTQVVILDADGDGPYFDLWRLFANKPTIRLSELPPGTELGNIIIPLPGGSNPIWQGDWEPNSCAHSKLLGAFSKRVMRYLNVNEFSGLSERRKTNEKIVVSFIERKGTRKLLDQDKHLASLSGRYAHADVRLVDLAAMTLAEQVQTVRDSDILVGVHGAGLTHGMWLRKHSVLVEILPEKFMHKGFRNLAGAMDLGYFSIHGTSASNHTDGGDNGSEKQGEETQDRWQTEDVVVEDSRFVALMDVAIASMYNRGRFNFDVNR